MREILFRGKRIDNGEWLEGYYMNLGNKYHYILSGKLDIAYGCLNLVKYPISPETIGQYTGLKDKNGKRIFEGDIVLHHNDNIYAIPTNAEKGLVYWDDMYCGWRRTSNGMLHNNVVKTYRMSNECDYEIIGNIHDNPELLEDT